MPFGTTQEETDKKVTEKTRDFFAQVNSRERVVLAWEALREKVKRQLAMFDSSHFCENQSIDVVTKNQVMIRIGS